MTKASGRGAARVPVMASQQARGAGQNGEGHHRVLLVERAVTLALNEPFSATIATAPARPQSRLIPRATFAPGASRGPGIGDLLDTHTEAGLVIIATAGHSRSPTRAERGSQVSREHGRASRAPWCEQTLRELLAPAGWMPRCDLGPPLAPCVATQSRPGTWTRPLSRETVFDDERASDERRRALRQGARSEPTGSPHRAVRQCASRPSARHEAAARLGPRERPSESSASACAAWPG